MVGSKGVEMIELYSLNSNGLSYLYVYHSQTGKYIYINPHNNSITEGECREGDFVGYEKNNWSFFGQFFTPSELIKLVEDYYG